MKAQRLALPEVLLLEPDVHEDERGYFFEAFSETRFSALLGRPLHFIQDNQSCSHKGVVRGLHYQLPPFAQGKLVRCIAGAIFDVAVDIRRSSPNFGRWVAEELSAENRRQLWVPPGFAHGFLSLHEGSEILYKVDASYDRASERAIRWDDPAIGICWPAGTYHFVSAKDATASLLANALLID